MLRWFGFSRDPLSKLRKNTKKREIIETSVKVKCASLHISYVFISQAGMPVAALSEDCDCITHEVVIDTEGGGDALDSRIMC